MVAFVAESCGWNSLVTKPPNWLKVGGFTDGYSLRDRSIETSCEVRAGNKLARIAEADASQFAGMRYPQRAHSASKLSWTSNIRAFSRARFLAGVRAPVLKQCR